MQARTEKVQKVSDAEEEDTPSRAAGVPGGMRRHSFREGKKTRRFLRRYITKWKRE